VGRDLARVVKEQGALPIAVACDCVRQAALGVDICEVGAHFLQCLRVGIRIPTVMDVLVSEDGKEFRTVAMVKHTPDQRPAYMRTLSIKLKDVTGRFVKAVGHNEGSCLFADEVFVNPEPGVGRQVLD
jgi:hypothetical protein